MISADELKVGDVLYIVKEKNLAFSRKKIHRVIDGEDWFKYDSPLREYEIEKITILGILRKTLEGTYDNITNYDLDSEFYVEYVNPRQTMRDDFYFDDNQEYFKSEEEAEVYKAKLEEQTRQKDIML